MPTRGPVRYALARKKAVELLTKGGVASAPVPVEQLAKLAGAAIRYEPFSGDDNLSGMVHRQPDGTAVIGVNSLHAETRQRFTIAHEIGHLLLHHDEQLHVDSSFPIGFRTVASSRAEDPKEIEANQFAAELLMPSALLTEDLKGRGLDLEDDSTARMLAQRYGVSVHAMTIRLSRFGTLR